MIKKHFIVQSYMSEIENELLKLIKQNKGKTILIVAPTGCGKTTFFNKVASSDIFPRQAITTPLKVLQSDEGIRLKRMNRQNKVVATTSHINLTSFTNENIIGNFLFHSHMDKMPVKNGEDYLLIIDEIHWGEIYAFDEPTCYYFWEALKEYKKKGVTQIWVSATPGVIYENEALAEKYGLDIIVEVKQLAPTCRLKNLYILNSDSGMKYSEFVKYVLSLKLKDIKEKGEKVILHVDYGNTNFYFPKGQQQVMFNDNCGTIGLSYINSTIYAPIENWNRKKELGLNIELIKSENRNNPTIQHILKTGKLPTDVDVIITTNFFISGINIHDEKLTTLISLCDKPYLTYQFISRQRLSNVADLYLLKEKQFLAPLAPLYTYEQLNELQESIVAQEHIDSLVTPIWYDKGLKTCHYNLMPMAKQLHDLYEQVEYSSSRFVKKYYPYLKPKIINTPLNLYSPVELIYRDVFKLFGLEHLRPCSSIVLGKLFNIKALKKATKETVLYRSLLLTYQPRPMFTRALRSLGMTIYDVTYEQNEDGDYKVKYFYRKS